MRERESVHPGDVADGAIDERAVAGDIINKIQIELVRLRYPTGTLAAARIGVEIPVRLPQCISDLSQGINWEQNKSKNQDLRNQPENWLPSITVTEFGSDLRRRTFVERQPAGSGSEAYEAESEERNREESSQNHGSVLASRRAWFMLSIGGETPASLDSGAEMKSA